MQACRQVVGNPYKLSPHSYGTSIDVNPVLLGPRGCLAVDGLIVRNDAEP